MRNALLNFTTLAATVGLAACSGGGGGSNSGGGIPPNSPPVITSATSVDVPENSTGTIYTATASDPDGDPVSYILLFDDDSTQFEFNGATGELSFRSPPNFEFPDDATGNNTYLISIRAIDGRGGQDTTPILINVTDVAETAETRRVVSGLNQPLFLAGIPGTDQVAVLQKSGEIRVVTPSTGAVETVNFLDTSANISTAGEGGLLGLAFSPDFENDRTFYLNVTNTSGDTEIRSYQMVTGSDTQADPATMDVILTVPQPFANHNGGSISFDSNGYLLIPLGDGGSAGDPGDRAQDVNELLGKVLRIDVTGDDFPADDLRDYAIPSDNPFASGGGAPEIWAVGLRNPYRSSVDDTTGFLYLDDVGQDAVEEISRVDLSAASSSSDPINFGWPIKEGTADFRGTTTATLTPPIAEYTHADPSAPGSSVTGGFVYRGPVDDLIGRYVFGDFTSGNIWSIGLDEINDGQTLGLADFRNDNGIFAPDVGTVDNVSSFGLDESGNLYVVDYDGEVFVIERNP